MSAIEAIEDTRTIYSQPGLAPERPRSGQIVRAIRDEARAKGLACNRKKASQFYGMLIKALEWVRRDGIYHVEPEELDSLHPIMEVVMPDNVVNPPAGSAHDLINRRFLRGDEFALVHTKSGARLEFCAIAVELRSI